MNTEIGELHSPSGNILLRMWYVSVEAGDRPFRRHSHTRFEISVVTGGQGTYRVHDRDYPIETGDVFVFASNEPHCITRIGNDGLSLINLHFEPRFLIGESADTLSRRHLNFCFAHDPLFSPRIPAKDSAPLRAIHDEMAKELQEKKTEYPLWIKSTLNRLIITLIRDYGYADGEETGNSRQFDGILKAMRMIDKHFADPLTLEHIAAAAGISPTYFSTLFKRFCGVSLWDYVIARRIECAAGMILTHDAEQTMLDIALASGFNNTANFNKAFRRQTGMTPTEYRDFGDIP